MVAIAPFRVSEADSSLAWLHEGIVELLTIRLVGEGGIPVADPAAVLRASGGSAIEVASRVGAVRLIEGTVTGTASQVTLSARLSVVPGGQVVARAVVEGSPDSLPQLLDRLAAQLLGLNAEVDGSRVASMTSASLPAIRAYLAGREAFRGGRMEDAVQRFREATLLDSTFALAGLELSRAAGWTKSDRDVGRGARIARSGQDRLSASDRALLDALTRQWANAPTMFERWNAVVTAYPARPENWYAWETPTSIGARSLGRRGRSRVPRMRFDAGGGWTPPPPARRRSGAARRRADGAPRRAGACAGRHRRSAAAREPGPGRGLDQRPGPRAHVAPCAGHQRFSTDGVLGQDRECVAGSRHADPAVHPLVRRGQRRHVRAAAEGTRRVLAHDPGYGSFALAVNALNAGRPGDIPEGTSS